MVSCPAMACQLLADGAAALWCLRGHIWRGIAATSRLAGLCGPMMLFVTVLDGLRSALMRQLGPCFGSWLAFGDRCLISMGHFRWLSIQIVDVMLFFRARGHSARFGQGLCPLQRHTIGASGHSDSPFCIRNAQSACTLRMKEALSLRKMHSACTLRMKEALPVILRLCAYEMHNPVQNAQSACTLRMKEALPTQNAFRFSVVAYKTHSPPALCAWRKPFLRKTHSASPFLRAERTIRLHDPPALCTFRKPFPC